MEEQQLMNNNQRRVHFERSKAGTEIPGSSFHPAERERVKNRANVSEAIPLISFQRF